MAFESDDHRVFTSPSWRDGELHAFMTATTADELARLASRHSIDALFLRARRGAAPASVITPTTSDGVHGDPAHRARRVPRLPNAHVAHFTDLPDDVAQRIIVRAAHRAGDAHAVRAGAGGITGARIRGAARAPSLVPPHGPITLLGRFAHVELPRRLRLDGISRRPRPRSTISARAIASAMTYRRNP